MAKRDVIFRNGIVANQDDVGETDTCIRDDRIATLGDLSRADIETVVDFKPLRVLLGLIGTQVHFANPAWRTKETSKPGRAVLFRVASVASLKCSPLACRRRETLLMASFSDSGNKRRVHVSAHFKK
ncbi:hypothetical protein [Tateyamaria sp. syn59]|uniref:hypothetical protein n=1 Tax=Tateyamaria sp. syn59 TaxID=2576942 RepID=UPI0011BDA90B|nr:hypothetical protein [Tateyamaria sp. syn59]